MSLSGVKLPALPSLQKFQTFLASMEVRYTFSNDLPTAGVVPTHGVAMDASLPWPEVLRPPANL